MPAPGRIRPQPRPWPPLLVARLERAEAVARLEQAETLEAFTLGVILQGVDLEAADTFALAALAHIARARGFTAAAAALDRCREAHARHHEGP